MLRSEFGGKPINKVSPFCPRATAEGMVGSGSAARFLTWKQGRKLYGSTVRVVQEQVLYLSAGGSSNRKEGTEGQKEVRKTTRAANSGPCSKGRDGKCTPRSPQISILAHWLGVQSSFERCRFNSGMCKPKSVQLQERKSTYCSAI